MFVSDVFDFKFVGKVKPAFFIAKEEVIKILLKVIIKMLSLLKDDNSGGIRWYILPPKCTIILKRFLVIRV